LIEENEVENYRLTIDDVLAGFAVFLFFFIMMGM